VYSVPDATHTRSCRNGVKLDSEKGGEREREREREREMTCRCAF
jgi:hypothetical protein